MHVYLPDDIPPLIAHDRVHPDGRVFRGLCPPAGIYLASWLLHFVRAHHDLPIIWPSPMWVRDNGESSRTNRFFLAPERPMVHWDVRFGRHAVELLKARGAADGEAPGVVLRRLLVQHFGRVPTDVARVTGGRHRATPGQGQDCATCTNLIADLLEL